MAQGILNTPREVTHQRIAAALEAIEQNMSDEHEAVNIDYDNTYSGLSADNVQEAIDELVNEKANTADLGTASAKNFTTSVTQGSNDLVTSGAVYNEFANLPKPEIFKGTLGVNGTITSLPTASSDNEGWEYKVITAGTYAGQDAKYGDTFISDGTQWVYIPSGDETDTDTWRGINVNGSQLLDSGISSGNVNFKSGTNAQVSGSGNDITVDVDTTFSDASSRTNIASGDSIKTILGKIKKWFSDLKTVAFSGSYNDLDNKPTIPSVGDGTLKIQKNGTNVATFTANQSGDVTVNIQCVDTVDSSMSDSSTNPLQNKVITKELEGAKTTTGNPLTIEDAAPVNAVNLSVDLEPIQDLHGYDHPWVGGAGKNKLPMTVDGIKAANSAFTWNGNVAERYGATATILTDGNDNVIGIKVNGTPSSQLEIYMPLVSNLGNAIINGCPANGSDTTYLITSKQGNTWTGLYDYGNGYEREITSNESVVIVIRSGYNAQNLIFQPMIRLSTETDATFAPYTNICPISGRSEVAIKRVGVNQWDEEWESGAILGNTGQNTPSSTKIRSVNYIPIFSGTTYYYKHSSTESDLFFYDENKTYINSISKNTSGTFTTPNNAKYVRFSILQTTYNNNISINYPSTDHDYHAYAGKTYTIQIGQTVYGCHVDATKGGLVVDTAEVDLGSLTWNLVSRNRWSTTDIVSTISSVSNSQVFNAISDRFVACSADELYNNESLIGMGENTSNHLLIRNGSTTESPTGQLVYELATSITIPLTPTQIKLLENTNTVYTDYEGDTITIEYQPNNAIGEAVMAVEESYDPEFAVRPVLKKKAFSGTTDSDGAVTLINASDIPSNHRIIPLQITDMTISGSAGTYFVEYKPYNSGDSVKGYCYTYFNGSQITPVGSAVTGIFYYYELEG